MNKSKEKLKSLNKNIVCEKELLALADDMVASVTSLNSHNYTNFIETRDQLKEKLHTAIVTIYELRDELEQSIQEYETFKKDMYNFCMDANKQFREKTESFFQNENLANTLNNISVLTTRDLTSLEPTEAESIISVVLSSNDDLDYSKIIKTA
jgi:predicted nuclease with TOPRIM domain